MIQRIQSLFLFGVVLISISLFLIPLSEKSSVEATSGANASHTLTLSAITLNVGGNPIQVVSNTYSLMVINLILLIIAAYTIFLYKNRSTQIKLCMLGGLIATGQLIAIFYYSEEMGVATVKPHYLAGVYLVAVQVLLLMAARRSIRKDEMLVRAADRIR